MVYSTIPLAIHLVICAVVSTKTLEKDCFQLCDIFGDNTLRFVDFNFAGEGSVVGLLCQSQCYHRNEIFVFLIIHEQLKLSAAWL